MKDLKTVMDTLEKCSERRDDGCDQDCPYWEYTLCDAQLMQDALEHLKRMEGKDAAEVESYV